MKKISLILLTVTALLFLGTGSVNAQENSSKMVIIRVVEGHGIKTGFVTIDSDGKTSKTALEKGHDVEISAKNGLLIQQELEKWKREGYKITHLATSGQEVSRTTIILEK